MKSRALIAGATGLIGSNLAEHLIVPIGASALQSSKIAKGAALKIYPGAPHGMCSTIKDQANADLLAFLRA